MCFGSGQLTNMRKRRNSSVLTAKNIQKIRKLGIDGYKLIDIGKRFSVSSSTIGQIVRREIFTDVPDEDEVITGSS